MLRKILLTTISFCALMAIALVTQVSSATAATYYFDSLSGSDSNTGVSEDQAWESLTQLNFGTLQPGDTIYFKKGSSWETGNGSSNLGLHLTASGTNGSPITLTTYGTGSAPTFTNDYNALIYTRAVTVSGDYYVIDGLSFIDTTEAGLYINDNSDNHIIRNSNFSGNAYGMFLGGDNNTIEDNNFHDAVMLVNTDNSGNDDSGAIGMLLNGSNNIIQSNTFEDNVAASFDFNTDGAAIEFYGEGGTGNATVENNIVRYNLIQNNDTVMEMGGYTNPTFNENIFYYNLMINNSRMSVVHLDGGFGATVTGLRYYNNTIYEDTTEWTGVHADRQSTDIIWFSAAPSSTTQYNRNNIFYVSGFTGFQSHASYTYDYNLYYFPAGSSTVSLAANDLQSNPLFMDAPNDFSLQESSPAIDSGTSLALTRDYQDETVPQGSGVDRGAFEHEAVPTPTPTPSPTLTPSPNTANGSSGQTTAPGPAYPKECADIRPDGQPQLYQIDVKDGQARLYFSPVSGATGYYVRYGNSSIDQHGSYFDGQDMSGARTIEINELLRNQTYSFEVRAQNGCMPGSWSNQLTAKTTKKATTAYTAWEQMKEIAQKWL